MFSAHLCEGLAITPHLSSLRCYLYHRQPSAEEGLYVHFAEREGPGGCGVIECFKASGPIARDSALTLYIDRQLRASVCAVLDSGECVELATKALALMPYPRALKEVLPTALPWVGLALCWLFILPIALRAARRCTRPAKFTFHPLFHLLTALTSLYPLGLLAADLGHWVAWAFFPIYLLQAAINGCATWQRNRRVIQFVQRLNAQIALSGMITSDLREEPLK
ncbi:MAG: hypothetical protein ACPG4U_10045 [Pseudomonadales bacterium]